MAEKLTCKRKPVLVTDSCGCVFCDLGFKRESLGGLLVHFTSRHFGRNSYVGCTAPPPTGRVALAAQERDT